LFSLPFVLSAPGSVNLSFAEVGNSDEGQLLDNVSVDTATTSAGAPLPSAAWGGLVLMGGMLAVQIRRKIPA
jgi:hypothetical protein